MLRCGCCVEVWVLCCRCGCCVVGVGVVLRCGCCIEVWVLC